MFEVEPDASRAEILVAIMERVLVVDRAASAPTHRRW
jgi:hypothetical protein